MSPKLEKILLKKYPKIFPNGRNVDPRVSLICFGFEIGDGWFWLLDQLCATIQNYIDHTVPAPPQVVALQVKEKYANLRFYYSGGDDYVYGMLRYAEHLSGITCEACGSTDPKHVGQTTRCYYKICCAECIQKLLNAEPHIYRWKSFAALDRAARRKEKSTKAVQLKAGAIHKKS